jgi:ATP-dependent Clp protease adapter protein ClpS
MEIPSKEKPGIDVLEEEDVSIVLKSRVILFNDDWHSFEEVIVQIIKAVNCSFNEAKDKAFETHVKGKSIIFNGEFNQCLRVSSVLEEIALHTQIIT